MSLLYSQFHAIGFLLYFIYDMFMDKFKILLNCNICEQVFDFEYTLTKYLSKFHLTFFFANSDIHNNSNNHHCNCSCSSYKRE